MGVWEVQRPQGRGLEGLGLAQGRLGTRIWAQHGPNLSQVGINLGPTWDQDEPTCSQLGPNLAPTGAVLETTWLNLGACWVHFWVPNLSQVGANLGAAWAVQLGGFGSLFEPYFGSCRATVGLWEARKPQGRTRKGFGRAWVGSGAAWDPDLGPT